MKHQRGLSTRNMGLRKLGREGTLRMMTKLHLLLFVVAFAVSSSAARGQTKDGCPDRCGNVTIPYPFGTKEGCYHDEGFLITCNGSGVPFLTRGNIPVLDISLSGELRVQIEGSYICYNGHGRLERSFQSNAWLSSSRNLSNKKNKFTAVGCDTKAILQGSRGTTYSTGCMSMCNSTQDIVSSGDGSCSGLGCCQTSIPRGVKDFNVTVSSFKNHTSVHEFNPCSHAFVVEDGYFNFTASDLKDLRTDSVFPIVFDWSIGNHTCKQVGGTSVCSENSVCIDSSNGPGYLCRCRDGYDGNPYLPNGCKDIDECTQGKHNCTKTALCQNTDGSFECRCPKGYHGDPKKDCTQKKPKWAIILLGTIIGVLVFLLGVCSINQHLRRRQDIKQREGFFEQNGGSLLRGMLSKTHQDIKIFTAEELKKSTDDYHKSRILGKGGQGIVYKGILPNNQEVAIKKAQIGDVSQVEQFINEVIMLAQINHKNVVRLLGCCLETEIPSLVYEFVNNGTLFDHLHRARFGSPFPWETRLKIAIETAGTLSYLHSYHSGPIIHRDVKSANILLDDKFTAKVSDFGSSRLIPADQKELLTLVQGTQGYLDPEYFTTSMLNEKSDVYSFGVVLMELLSGQKALCFNRPEKARHLAASFASALKESRLDEVLDKQVANAKNHKQLEQVAWLALSRTSVKGEERPPMEKVASELKRLGVVEKQKRADVHSEEAKHLPGDHVVYVEGDNTSSSFVSGFDSAKNVGGSYIEAGR